MQLLDQLGWITDNCCRMFELIQDDAHSFCPQEGMRNLAQIANHLAQVPAIDLAIMKGGKEKEVQDLEVSLECATPAAWAAMMAQGKDELYHYMDHLSLDQYENDSGTAFYGRTQTNAQWLLEVITHLYHHRSQLYLYLKLSGCKVNASGLYS